MNRPTSESERHEARRNWWDTAKIAEECGGVTTAQVRDWIDGGELRAMDVSSVGAKRPEWRSRPEWVEAFKARRTKNAEAA